jgi:rubrerythrin
MNSKLINWFNDGAWKCNHCGAVFKVYVKDGYEDVQFCPYCSSTGDIIACDENGNEINDQ